MSGSDELRNAIKQFEFRDATTGEYCQAKTDSEAAARQLAAESIGADPSDLRRIHVEGGKTE